MLSKVMHDIYNENRNYYYEIQHEILHYFELIKKEKLTVGFFKDSFFLKSKHLLILWYLLKLIVLFPIYIFGLTINYILYIAPYKIYKSLKLDIEYKFGSNDFWIYSFSFVLLDRNSTMSKIHKWPIMVNIASAFYFFHKWLYLLVLLRRI